MKVGIIITIVAAVFVIALIGLTQHFKSGQKEAAFDSKIYIVRVGTTGITRDEYQKRLNQTNSFFGQNNQKVDPSTVQNNVLNQMIDETLVFSYAKEHGITVSDSEIEGRYRQVVAGFNKNKTVQGDSMFLNKIQSLYGIGKDEYLSVLKTDILKEKVQQAVGEPLTQWLASEKQSVKITLNN